ncbi:MAG: DNA mismatch repair endonuclease MutL [Thermoplasmata archaeon]|nr:DNA mismatch repair endonuclease MutL [Thermoplasmata archaeon]
MTASRRPIRRLDAGTVERIAAGEVVERPASVVKELLENAIDAEASHIVVRIDGGGIERIEVADDGVGIPPAELALALERHATSKLEGPDGLDAIRTLGFRGEALAAVASVSHLRLVSRARGEEAATGLESIGGVVGEPFLSARAPGTTVTVARLFFNTPARRKFLRPPAREQLEVVDTVERSYLALPRVGLELSANGSELLRLPASADLGEAAAHVLGPEFAAASIEVHQVEGPRVRVEGCFARPEVSRGSARGLYLSVNGRPIVSRPFAQSVRVAYADRLPRTRFPVGVLHLELDPSKVDVNVHPTKREVRFEREAELLEVTRRAVRAALEGGGPANLPSAPRDRFSATAPALERPLPEFLAPPAPGHHTSPLQSRLDAPSTPPKVLGAGAGPELALLGVVGRLYWLAESGEDLLLLDQHAASERLLFAQLLGGTALAQQRLVSPVSVRLTPREAGALSEHSSLFRSAGFEVEEVGGGTWWVRGVPSYRGRIAPAEELPRLLAELADGGRPAVPDGLAERRAASVACHAAVRAGDRIEPEEMRRILDAVYRLPGAPSTCPHGRPIALRLPRSRLDRWFGRSGI